MFHCLFIVLKIPLFSIPSSHDPVIRMFHCLFFVFKISLFSMPSSDDPVIGSECSIGFWYLFLLHRTGKLGMNWKSLLWMNCPGLQSYLSSQYMGKFSYRIEHKLHNWLVIRQTALHETSYTIVYCCNVAELIFNTRTHITVRESFI
jgi:hypothetical protein